jgi:hypothetical protein
MIWREIPRNPTAKVLRQFAGAWLIVFALLAAKQYRQGHHNAALALAAVAVVAGIPGLIKPGLVRWLFVTLMVLAFPIGWTVSQLMLLLMYYIILTPVALLLRIRGRDPLLRKPQRDRESYWLAKETPRDVRSYFRQY